jgi:hypothetical protein
MFLQSVYLSPHPFKRETRKIEDFKRDLQRLQIINQIAFLSISQVQSLKAVVVVDHIEQSRKATIVVETTCLMCPETSEWCGAVAFIWRTFRLKIVNADLGGRVHIPSGLGE